MTTLPPLEIFERLALSIALGGMLGVEREYRHKPAGLRTNILIALGSTLFSLVSMQFAGMEGSADRVAARCVHVDQCGGCRKSDTMLSCSSFSNQFLLTHLFSENGFS